MSNQVTASNKLPFALLSMETLALEPELWTRTSMTDPTWKKVSSWQGGSMGTPTTTELKTNNYNMESPYISDSTSLMLTGADTNIVEIKKDAGAVTYSSTSPKILIEENWSWDIMANVSLRFDGQKNQGEPRKNGEHGVIYLTGAGEASRSKSAFGTDFFEMPNDRYFTFTTNTNMYFSIEGSSTAAIHMMQNDKLVKVENRILEGFASHGGRYALSDNQNNLYPSGITTLIINDGFSESTAKIQFNHNTENKTVKISITKHTAKLCELRGPEIAFAI
ncbi:hypothetical protein LJJ44_05560 [Pseudomonas sp. B24_DOA]|nr:hypothetical protein LJJ44_05560 [Pseudomonas sp. B24_DOA]WKV91002.1 hypothetical protein LJU32_13580 [Pseudomonas sp. B21_DOA]